MSADRQDLFAAWRLFFERLADSGPAVLAFEDMQWADTSLLDFIEYLLEWSRDHPLFVITLARPEIHDRRPSWGAGQRNFSALYLDPLSEKAMHDLLDGLVPGLPARLRDQILARAEGVPLYAMETVRMLLDRGLLEQAGAVYRPTGEIETLTMSQRHSTRSSPRASTASRRKSGGCSRTERCSARRSRRRPSGPCPGLREAELEPLLSSLVRKEVLGVQADTRSPEHGQYGFLQDLVRHVAYETLSRRERKARHLMAADYVEQAFGDVDEVAEVLASHYVAAFDAMPDADDAAEIRARAREMLTQAGDRAASLGAPKRQRYFEQAAELADDIATEAALVDRAGRLAAPAGRLAEGRERLERAIGLFGAVGDLKGAAELRSRSPTSSSGTDASKRRLPLRGSGRRARAGPPSAELAAALAQSGGSTSSPGTAISRSAARARARDRRAPPTARGVRRGADEQGARPRAQWESRRGADPAQGRCRAGVCGGAVHERPPGREQPRGDPSVARSPCRGTRRREPLLTPGTTARRPALGVDDARRLADPSVSPRALGRGGWRLRSEEKPIAVSTNNRSELLTLTLIHCWRGETTEARASLEAEADLRTSANPQAASAAALFEAVLLRSKVPRAQALAAAERGSAYLGDLPIAETVIKLCLIEAIESALALGDLDKAAELLCGAGVTRYR